MQNEYLGLDVGQAHELKLAFRRFDWDNTLIKRLCESDILGDTLDILRGDAHPVPLRRMVDLSADPLLEEGHQVVKHLKQGKKLWSKIRLAVMCPDELQYTYISGPWNSSFKPKGLTGINRRTMMPRFLLGQRPANICMRDFLFENPHLIPRRWPIHKPILFWGTVCRNDWCDYVPGLSLNYGKWSKYGRRIDRPDISLDDYDNPCVVFAPALPD